VQIAAAVLVVGAGVSAHGHFWPRAVGESVTFPRVGAGVTRYRTRRPW
jgi:hypothetical protein